MDVFHEAGYPVDIMGFTKAMQRCINVHALEIEAITEMAAGATRRPKITETRGDLNEPQDQTTACL